MKRSISLCAVLVFGAIVQLTAAEVPKITLFDYVKWRGDLTFEQDSINEIDSTILSMISYIPFDSMIIHDSFQDLTLAEAAKIYFADDSVYKNYDKLTLVEQNTIVMFEHIASSRRFADIKLTYYVNHFDENISKQFSAVTFSLNPNLHFIAFRGTDNTITGWKEDFNMSFEKIIPSQQEALLYLDTVARKLPGTLIIGGHSKGGNLAVYAAIKSSDDIQNRIKSIWNFDGPGFFSDDEHKKLIAPFKNRIHTFLPEGSIVGMLLQHEEPYEIISCEDSILFQHNPFIWEIEPCRFIKVKQVSDTSQIINESIRTWLSTKSPQEIEAFFDVIFKATQNAGIKTIQDLNKDTDKVFFALIDTYKSYDPEMKKMLRETAASLITISFQNMQAKAEMKVAETFPFIKKWKK